MGIETALSTCAAAVSQMNFQDLSSNRGDKKLPAAALRLTESEEVKERPSPTSGEGLA